MAAAEFSREDATLKLEQCMWSAEGVIEHFTSPADTFQYTITYALYAFDEARGDFQSIRKGVVNNHALDGPTMMTRLNISDFQRLGSTMRLTITDMTTYIPRQPLLSMDVVLNEGAADAMRLPAPFSITRSAVPVNRQMDMPLPNVRSMALEMNVKEMQKS